MAYTKVTELPENVEELSLKKFIISSNDVSDVTHTFHKYPAKFIPHIPRWAIKFVSKDKLLVIDPFCGSGTTNLEAFLLGYPSIGFDIDPLALLISKVKITPIAPSLLRKSGEQLISQLKDFSSQEEYAYPEIENLDHWFTKDAKKKIAFIKRKIFNLPEGDTRDFFIIVLSSIIREVSNADNQSQKTYVSHTLVKKPPEAFTLFKKRLNLYTERILHLNKITIGKRDNKPLFIKTDSRTDISKYIDKLDRQSFRLIVTSPPYIKAIDYIYNQMLEYYWFGELFNLEGRKKMNEYKRKYIGTKQVYSREYHHFKPKAFKVRELDEAIQKIYRRNNKYGYITYSFFASMKKNLSMVSKFLRRKELYIIVVGNTSVSNIRVNTDEYLSKLAIKLNFKPKVTFSYKIRNRYMRFDRKGRGGIVDEDNVLVLEKN